MFKPLTLLTLSIMASSAVAQLKEIVPMCMGEADNSVTLLEAEKKFLHISLVPMILVDGQVRYGYDVANVTEQEYKDWSNQCNDQADLVAFVTETNRFMPFKSETNIYSNLYFKEYFTTRKTINTERERFNELTRYYNALSFLRAVASLGDKFSEITSYMEDTNDLTVYLTRYAEVNHAKTENNQLNINYWLLNQPYESKNGAYGPYTFYRALTHQLVHEAMPSDTAEPDIIDMTNKILSALSFIDEPRSLYDTTDVSLASLDRTFEAWVTSTESRRARRAVARRQPTPEERLDAFFYRDPAEFARDPAVWMLGATIGTQIGTMIGPSVSLAFGAVRPVTPPISPSSTRLLADTSAITVVSSASSDAAIGAAEAAIEAADTVTADIEVAVENFEVAGTFDAPETGDATATEPVREIIITEPAEHLVQPSEPVEFWGRSTARSRIRMPDTSSRADSASITSRTRQPLFSRSSLLGPELYELSDLSSIGSGEEALSNVFSETQDTSLTTIHEPSLSSAESIDIITDEGQRAFLAKINADIIALELPIPREIEMRALLNPTAHYITQAPELIRQYLAGEITVETLAENLPKL